MNTRQKKQDVKPKNLVEATRLRVSGQAVNRELLRDELARQMEIGNFKDYCPNGLQVEGRASIRKLALAVTASRNAIDAAVAWKADALLVHHGLFWKGDDPVVVGPLKQRLKRLLDNEINLFAYHLPLDCHSQWGNNRGLGLALGFPECTSRSDDRLIWGVDLKQHISASQLQRRLTSRLGRRPTIVGDLQRPIRRLLWCTGGAQGYLSQAIALGADAFVSGEISEQTTHLARESGVVYAAAGHHATERFGVQGLGLELSRQFGLEAKFFDDQNPA